MAGKTKTEETIGLAYKFSANLVARFGALCSDNGVSQREGIRRALLFCVMEGRIPGIEAYELTPDATEPSAPSPIQAQRGGRPLRSTQRYGAVLKRSTPAPTPAKSGS